MVGSLLSDQGSLLWNGLGVLSGGADRVLGPRPPTCCATRMACLDTSLNGTTQVLDYSKLYLLPYGCSPGRRVVFELLLPRQVLL